MDIFKIFSSKKQPTAKQVISACVQALSELENKNMFPLPPSNNNSNTNTQTSINTPSSTTTTQPQNEPSLTQSLSSSSLLSQTSTTTQQTGTTSTQAINPNAQQSSNSNNPQSSPNSSNNSETKRQKMMEEVGKYIILIKDMLYGDGEKKPSQQAIQEIQTEALQLGLLNYLVEHLAELDFEPRKAVASILCFLVKVQTNGINMTVNYLLENLKILEKLMDGYKNSEIATQCGVMVRACLEFPMLHKQLLMSEKFFDLFQHVSVANFEIASDAFLTFREFLLKHKSTSAHFLLQNYDTFFQGFSTLLKSNYATQRLSLRLLSELLLDRTFFDVMKKYIQDPENLKMMMNFFLAKSRNIQFEAFHVFKVFVANPNKPKKIKEILFLNKDQLVDYLKKFNKEKEETDEQFKEEKAMLIDAIQKLTDSE